MESVLSVTLVSRYQPLLISPVTSQTPWLSNRKLNNMKKIAAILAAVVMMTVGLSACQGQNDADVASKNLSTAADNFEIYRQVVFYNGITGEYIAEVDGFCSIG